MRLLDLGDGKLARGTRQAGVDRQPPLSDAARAAVIDRRPSGQKRQGLCWMRCRMRLSETGVMPR
jgi:hypothetical protein